MNKIDILIKKLNKFPDDMRWYKTCISVDKSDIENIEKKLDYNFPSDFRYYLLNYNWLSIPYEYIYWIKKLSKSPYVFDILEISEKLYKNKLNPMPKYLVPFSPNWRWDHYCFNKKDNKIYFWQHDCYDYNWNPDFDSETFIDWLDENIKSSLEILNDR